MDVVRDSVPGNSISAVEDNTANLIGTGVRNSILGVGFLIISALTYLIPGDTHVWLVLLFPAIALLASGIGRLIKGKTLNKNISLDEVESRDRILSTERDTKSLPPTSDNYIKPSNSFSVNDDPGFSQPSVVEETTRHLKKTLDRKTNELPKE